MAINRDADVNLMEDIGPEGITSQEMLLNMGPQHPSTHGVLRLVLKLEGETVVDCTPVIGYLHRGIEKILENRPVMGGIRYMDNADYLSPLLNEIAYAGAVEQLMGMEPPRRAQYIRLLTGEMQRIASHLVRSVRILWTWEHLPLSCGRSATAKVSFHSLRPCVGAASM